MVVGGITRSGTIRACAGCVADDGVHSVHLTFVVSRAKQPLPNAALRFSFRDNASHADNENKRAKMKHSGTSESWDETLSSTTNSSGVPLGLTVLSSDLICHPALVIEWQNEKSQWVKIETVACDFAAAEQLRRFPNWTDPSDTGDSGWIFDAPHFDTPNRVTPVKVYLKFKIDLTRGDAIGNWKFVNGHTLELQVDGVDINSDAPTFSGQLQDYATIVGANLVVTGANPNSDGIYDGAASAMVQAGSKVDDADVVWFAAQDQTQWSY